MANQKRFSVESGSTLTPFWRRVPRFFVYPMQMGSIMRITGYSLLGGLAMFISNIFGSLSYFILWIVFLKYAFVVMERTAVGRFDEPKGLQDSEEGDAAQVIRQYALFFILGLLVGALFYLFGATALYAGSLLLNIMIPACIMIIAVNRSLLQALNPAQILFYIRTIGSPYLALCGFLMSLTSSSQWVQGFLYQHMDSWLVLPLLSFIDFYFVLIIYHMMGYAIYQYHDLLGVRAAVSFEEAEARQSSDKGGDQVLSKLGTLIANGQQDEAIELLRKELRTHWENNDLHERYQKLLRVAGKQIEALHHAREFIAKLVTEKRLFQALDLCEECLNLDPEFQLQDSYQVHDLAIAARMGRRFKLALDLMRRFDGRYPEHPHIPAVYLLSAQILSEHYRMNKEAMQILQVLLARFPDHAMAKEARQYQEALIKVAAMN
jgi:tetratricopeptide (TPR) repeat protein